MKKQPEFELQKMVCRYLSMQYPTVLYMTDSIASCKLTQQQASRNKLVQKAGFHCPDLIIFEKRGEWGGLFIELKAESPFYKKEPTVLKANEHIEAQQATIKELNAKGYKAMFAWDFDQIKAIIDDYLNL